MVACLIPPTIFIDDREVFVDGEYAFCIFLYRMHYPGTLASLQSIFGRDYTQIGKVYNAMVEFIDFHHQGKVIGNLNGYANRFNDYNRVINYKIQTSPSSPFPEMIPVELSNFFGFADGTARYIHRPGGHMQQLFWNEYYHQHCLIYLGISFPDGMQVIELPHPGYFTDVMVWNICRRI